MKKSINQFGLAIDWETSGYSLPHYTPNHQGLSFGAIIYDTTTFKTIESLYHEIKFNKKFIWDFGAERVHGLTRDHLKTHGIDQEQAATDLANLIIKYVGTDDIMLLGHRVHFDKAFTNQLMDTIGIQLNYSPLMIDSSAFGTVFLESSYSNEVFKLLGFPPRKFHNALEDIQYTLLSIQLMKDYFLEGLNVCVLDPIKKDK